MRNTIYKKKNWAGFTLLEILVVMSIGLLISTGSYLAFSRFGKQQSLNISYENLKNSLNEAKANSVSQVTTLCTVSETLVGHQVRFYTSTTPDSWAIEEVCKNNINAERSVEVKTQNLSSDITFVSSPAPILFLVLSGEIRGSLDRTLTITNGSKTKTITVNATGIIQ